MKACMLTVMCLAVFATANISHAYYREADPVESPYLVNLKGTWFIRGEKKCAPVKLDRKGRSELMLESREYYVDKRADALYLTVKAWPYTYTYRMNPIEWGESYILELIAVGPDDTAGRRDVQRERFTGFFRTMVDCQLGIPRYSDGSDSRVREVRLPPGS